MDSELYESLKGIDVTVVYAGGDYTEIVGEGYWESYEVLLIYLILNGCVSKENIGILFEDYMLNDQEVENACREFIRDTFKTEDMLYVDD